MNKPTGYKKGADAVAPFPLMRLSKTFPKDNDNNRHPRQSFIYNTFLTDMLIYTVRVEYLLNHLSLVESC